MRLQGFLARVRSLDSRRNRLVLALLLLLLGLRIAAPYVLRPLLVDRIDQALVGRVEIADLSLSLIRGGVELAGVATYANERPPEAAAPPAEAPAAPAAAPASGAPAAAAEESNAPLVTASRLWAQISWLELLRKRLVLEEIELEGFAVNLDRAQAGALVLPQLVARPEAKDEPDPTPSTWSVLASSVTLQDGHVRFRDFSLGDAPNILEISIERLTAQDLPIVLVEEGRAPGRIQLAAQLEDGRLALDATIESGPAGPSILAKLDAENVPIRNTRLYLGDFGWSELRGHLDAALEHRFVSGGEHRLRGSLGLDDLAVVLPGDERSLAWKKLALEIDDIDLVKHHAKIAKLTLDGARVTATPFDPLPLPAVRRSKTGRPKSGPPAEPPPVSAGPAQAEPSAPWTWQLGRFELRDALAHVVGHDGALDLGIEATLSELASREGARSPVSLAVKLGEGSLGLDGALSLSPVAFAGKLRWSQLDLLEALGPLGLPATKLVRSGSSAGELDLRLSRLAGEPAGAGEGAGEGDLRIAGRFELAKLSVAADDPKQFAVGCDALELGIRQIVVPGLLAPAAAAPRAPIRVDLERLKLARPLLRLTRSATGIVLPPFSDAPASAETSAVEAPPPADAKPPGESAPVRVAVARAAIERGRIEVVDRSVSPFYRGVLDPINLTAESLRWPGPEAEAIALDARGLTGALLTGKGRLAPGASKLELSLSELPLQPFNPYAVNSGYSIGGGKASLASKLSEKKGSYKASNRLVLHQLEMRGEAGESVFQEQFGVPLSVALALLRDIQGDITFKIPVEMGGQGTQLGLGTAIGNALVSAIMGALVSPLKLVSAVASIGGRVASITPEPVLFLAGRTQLAAEQAPRIEQLAELLASSPRLNLSLEGVSTPEDARWLAEQALREQLEASQGLAALRHLTERAPRNASLAYLQARAAGGEGELGEAHRAWFEAHVAEQQVAAEALPALALARATGIQTQLAQEHGIAAERVILAPAAAAAEGAPPSVVVGFAAGERAAPQPLAEAQP